MTILKMVQELVLSLCIATLLPITVYLGISSLYPMPEYKSFEVKNNSVVTDAKIIQENEEIQREAYKKATAPIKSNYFYVYIAAAILCFIGSSLIQIKSIAIGLILAGFTLICLSLTSMPEAPVSNFIFFLLILLGVFYLALVKNKQE